MSQIIEKCREYRQGRITFAELKEFMDGIRFLDPWRNHPDIPTSPPARAAYIDDNAMDTDGTLWELMSGIGDGYITMDEYFDLLMGRAEK